MNDDGWSTLTLTPIRSLQLIFPSLSLSYTLIDCSSSPTGINNLKVKVTQTMYLSTSRLELKLPARRFKLVQQWLRGGRSCSTNVSIFHCYVRIVLLQLKNMRWNLHAVIGSLSVVTKSSVSLCKHDGWTDYPFRMAFLYIASRWLNEFFDMLNTNHFPGRSYL